MLIFYPVRLSKLNIFLPPLLRQAVAASLIVILSFLIYYFRLPGIKDIKYFYNGREKTVASLPISERAVDIGEMKVSFSIVIRPGQGQRLFQMQTDDCVKKLQVNQTVISPQQCVYKVAQTIYLEPYLKTGTNTVNLTVRNVKTDKIGLDFSLWADDPVLKAARFLAAAAILLFLLSAFNATLGRKSRLITVVFAAGMILRYMYVISTPYEIRSYDLPGHLEYIRYIATKLTLPPANTGWEYHQSPLYYLLVSPLYHLGLKLHFPAIGLTWIQLTSLVLSFLTLFAVCWTGMLIFGGKKERLELSCFCLLGASFSGLIFFSSRISNDVLYQLCAFLFFGLLIKWWKDGTSASALLLTIAVAAGILTKMSAALFIPIFWICVLFRPGTTSRQKLNWLMINVNGIALVAGWFFVSHWLKSDLSGFLSFGGMWNQHMTIAPSWRSFLTINPLSLLDTPFVSPWLDPGGRQYFWIFFFKSALFGEFSFSGAIFLICQLMLALALGLLIIAFLGIIKTAWKKDESFLPMFITLLILILGAAIYLLYHPSAANQDFRFSILLLGPGAYFISRSIKSSVPLMEATAVVWTSLFVMVSSLFILGIYLIA